MTIKLYQNGWDKVADGGVTPDVTNTRQTINFTTGVDSGTWTETTGFLDTKLFSFVLLKAEFSVPCWFTLYTDAAARDADTRTDRFQDPLNSSGVLAEFITTSETDSPYLNLCTPAPICMGDGTYIYETTGPQCSHDYNSHPTSPTSFTNLVSTDRFVYQALKTSLGFFYTTWWVWDGVIIKGPITPGGGDVSNPIVDGYLYPLDAASGPVDSGTWPPAWEYPPATWNWSVYNIEKQTVNTIGRTNLAWKARNFLGGAWTQVDITLTVVPITDNGLPNYMPGTQLYS